VTKTQHHCTASLMLNLTRTRTAAFDDLFVDFHGRNSAGIQALRTGSHELSLKLYEHRKTFVCFIHKWQRKLRYFHFSIRKTACYILYNAVQVPVV